MLGILFILLINNSEAIVVVNPFGPTVSSEYANCINQLVDSNFKEPGLVVVANTLNATTHIVRIREEILKYLHEKFMYSIRTENMKEHVVDCDDKVDQTCDQMVENKLDKFTVIPLADYYVIIVGGFTEYKYIVNKIITLRSWNPTAIFIILCFQLQNLQELKTKKYPERMLTYLFKYNAIKAVVVIPDESNYRNGIVYGWRPFDPPRFCGYHNETAANRLRVESVCRQGVLSSKDKLFENIVPVDVTGCFLDIVAIERAPFISSDPSDPTLEKELLEEIISLLNLKSNYLLINDFRGEKDEEGIWGGALTHLTNGASDILVGGVFPDYEVHEDFDNSNCYFADSYTWVVPRAQKAPPWMALIVIFKKFVWLTAAATFFVCVFTWKTIAILSKDTKYHKTFIHCLLNTWYTSLGFASYMRPVQRSLRLFFVFLNLYCILFLTAYQTKLIDVLTHPSFEKQIETIEELIDSHLKVGGAEELHDLFLNSSDPFDYKIGEVWIDIIDVESALMDVVIHKNFSILISRLEMSYLAAVNPKLSDNFGNPTYYEFEGSVFTVPLEIVALRGFPFLEKFNYYLGILTQCGTSVRIKRMFKNLSEIRKAKLLDDLDVSDSKENPLSLSHLEGGFLALIMGYVSGTLVLIIEIIWNTQYVRKKVLLIRNYINLNIFRKNE